MTVNLGQMIDEVKSNLQGYTLHQDRITHLTAAINATATAIPVGNANNLAKGVIEVDDELIWIDSYDRSNNTLNAISTFGRGYQNTAAAGHAQFAPVIISPAFPRISVKRAINDAINAAYPKVWGVGTTTFTFNSAQSTYSLPALTDEVLSVTWESVGPSKEWIPVRRWRTDFMANTTAFTTGKSITIGDAITPGRTVQVYYTKEPTPLNNNGDDFETVTGLPTSCRDVVVLGAAYRLLSYIDPGRINVTSAEADAADSRLPSNASTASARYIFALYQQRLQEEADKLKSKYPTRLHFTR